MDRLLKLTDIKVENRFRKDYGDLSDLARKIRATDGIKFNAIIVEQIGEEYHLRAGGRRFQTYQLLSTGNEEVWQGHVSFDGIERPSQEEMDHFLEIPCQVLKDLTPIDRLRVEFIENMGRKDFLWPEASALVTEFHKLMQEKYGQANSGPGKDGWSVRDTSRELGLNPADVLHYLHLADGLVKDPTLKEIKQKAKALTKMKRNKRTEIATMLELEDYSIGDIKILCNDSRVALLQIEDESFDLVVTDPPWGINFEERIKDDRNDVYLSYDQNFDPLQTLEILIQCNRILKPNSAIYMFYSSLPEKIMEGVNLLKGAGFNTEQVPLIWYKKHVLSHDSRETRHGLNYESILYGWKGERPFLNEPHRNVFEFQVAYQNRIHASEKPEGLLSEILLLHTAEGDRVLDPFGGSCRVADACKSTLRRCLVVEKEEELVKLANMRLRGL